MYAPFPENQFYGSPCGDDKDNMDYSLKYCYGVLNGGSLPKNNLPNSKKYIRAGD